MTRLNMMIAGCAILPICLSACGSSPAASLPTPELTVTDTQPATEVAPTATTRSFEPQDVQFPSADGTALAATYWPPTHSPAPGIVLMHMMGHDRDSWGILPALLQGAGVADTAGQAQSYAVLAFDFRGHGESDGSASDRAGMLDDAKAALAYIQSMPEVDKSRIVLIGASVGADAAVDACTEGCIGAISLSPGSFLGPDYNDALSAIASKPVLCVASEGDSHSADTCRGGEQVSMDDYQFHIYTGSAHGTDMFAITDEQPQLTDLVFEWLSGHITGE
jgi:dienelactone hydrolase